MVLRFFFFYIIMTLKRLFSAVTVVHHFVLEGFWNLTTWTSTNPRSSGCVLTWSDRARSCPKSSNCTQVAQPCWLLQNTSAMWMSLYDFGSELAHVWPFEEQTDKLASVCTCPWRHTLKLLNSWFFFFFNVTVNNEYGMSSNHHGAEISSTKKIGKTMQTKWDFFFLPHP